MERCCENCKFGRAVSNEENALDDFYCSFKEDYIETSWKNCPGFVAKNVASRKSLIQVKAMVKNYAKTKSRDFVEGCITAMYDSCIVDWDIYEKILLEVIPGLYEGNNE